ncbi:MAG: VOC family protein [Hellea sp.]|nr:VOC family protein [Hellea sp.]
MTQRNRPQNYPAIAPYIFANDALGLIRFITSGLGAREIGRSHMPDGTIANCQLRIDDAVIMVTEARGTYRATRGAYYLYVDDVDKVMKRAIEAGAILNFEAMDMPYGDRQGGVKDPEGNLWWISKRLSDEPYF